jgi:hypothetical protein
MTASTPAQRHEFDLGWLDRRVLLSGAGLSRNWGGYLASEMWGAILSDPRVQNEPRLRELLLKEMNFETALAVVQSQGGAFDDSCRRAMDEAVRSAFRLQDANICHALTGRIPSSWTRFADGIVRQLIGKDQHHPDMTSFYFTLNQDILFERGFSPPIPEPPNMPGVPSKDGFWRMPREHEARPEPFNDQKHRVELQPLATPTFQLRERFNYIKLHGSFNWDDGENAMLVLGGGKEEAIARFPLLQAYFDLFRQVLMTGNIRLFVVGYSFNDGHVNQAIADAVRLAGLKLVIMDPRPAQDLRNQLLLADLGVIWSGLVDFISRPPGELFATDWGISLSGEFERLQRSFLQYAA